MMLDTYQIDSKKAYGERLLAELQKKGKRPAWLARQIRASQSTVSRLINGETSPSTENMLKIRKILGISYSEETDLKRPAKLELFERIATLDDMEADAFLPKFERLFAAFKKRYAASHAQAEMDKNSDESTQ